MAQQVLVVLGDGVVSGATIAEQLRGMGADLDAAVVTSKPVGSFAKYSRALCLSAADTSVLAALPSCLEPSATVHVHAAAAQQDQVHQALVLAGFINLSAAGETVSASMPGYEVGAKSGIQLKHAGASAISQTAAAAPPAAAAGNAWMLAADADDELLDDEELLTEEDRKRPVAAAPDDCEVGASGRKACKNCTCGRAEADAKPVKLTQDMLDNPQSACGNCSLGDAFRCAGCPYRGLPSFEAGKKIELAADFLTADA